MLVHSAVVSVESNIFLLLLFYLSKLNKLNLLEKQSVEKEILAQNSSFSRFRKINYKCS